MKLKTKLLSNLLAVSLVTALVVALLSVFSAGSSLEKKAFDQLESIREIKTDSIKRYIETINHQILSLASSTDVVQSTLEFTNAFASYPTEINLNRDKVSEFKNGLSHFYQNSFLSQFDTTNRSARELAAQQPDTTAALQHDFIVDNPHPVGSKHLMDNMANDSRYAKIHQKVHPFFRDYLQRFGYYDIFIVDAKNGNVIYSVFKEVDYATSLKNGPFRDSGLGRAFRQAATLRPGEESLFIDFSPYEPSYNAPAGFVATPVFHNNQTIGVLIFQFPISQVNQIMAERSGLGETGESYLVGSDYLMRSDSYLNPDDHSVVASFKDPEKGKVKTQATTEAFAGNSNAAIITDYNGNPVLSAYAPLSFYNLSWAILVEIDRAEAMADIYDLRLNIAWLVLACVVIVVPLGIYISNSVIKPLGAEPATMVSIAQSVANKNLTLEFDPAVDANTVYGSMREMSINLRSVVEQISKHSSGLASVAEQTSAASQHTRQAVEQQRDGTDQVATAITEMSATVQEISNNTAETASISDNAQSQVHSGSEKLSQTSQTVTDLVAQVEQTGEVIQQLHQESQKIGTVLDVIQTIAEQTNLLALNAAIEAARAGDHGRGFAVVADEVRSLAQKTQGSASDIQHMVESIQSGATRAIDTMGESQRQVQQTSELTEQTNLAFDELRHSVEKIGSMAAQIATATEQQSLVTNEVDNNIVAITSLAEQTYSGAQEIQSASSEVASAAEELSEIVSQFRT